MASVIKMTAGQVPGLLRHNTRELFYPAQNEEIDPNLTHLNYNLGPYEGAKESKSYYKQRLSEVYVYGRKNVITACQWVCTAPKDLPQEEEEKFFQETYNFLNSLYGRENCIQCTVHYDEGIRDKDGQIIEGRPHLHYVFIPAIENEKFGVEGKNGPLASSYFHEKLGANQVIRRRTLHEFHPKYQAWLDDAGVNASVHTGITEGKSRTVKELKRETKAIMNEREKELEWGHSDAWGLERSLEWTR